MKCVADALVPATRLFSEPVAPGMASTSSGSANRPATLPGSRCGMPLAGKCLPTSPKMLPVDCATYNEGTREGTDRRPARRILNFECSLDDQRWRSVGGCIRRQSGARLLLHLAQVTRGCRVVHDQTRQTFADWHIHARPSKDLGHLARRETTPKQPVDVAQPG